MTNRQMEMGKLCGARKTHAPKNGTAHNATSGFNANGALRHVAILRLPTVFVINHNTIATFFTRYIGLGCRCQYRVRHAIPNRLHPTIRDSQNGNTLLLNFDRWNPKIRPIMALIGHRATMIIAVVGARAVIDIILNKAIATQRTFERKGKMQWISSRFSAPRLPQSKGHSENQERPQINSPSARHTIKLAKLFAKA
jgi:hypothetical protein